MLIDLHICRRLLFPSTSPLRARHTCTSFLLLAFFTHLHSVARSHTVQRPLFFIHSLSSPNPLTLPSLKALITEVYLKRHDPRIEELIRERRPGRPKPKELLDLEEVKKREAGEYETGMGGSSFLFAIFQALGFGSLDFLHLFRTFPGSTGFRVWCIIHIGCFAFSNAVQLWKRSSCP